MSARDRPADLVDDLTEADEHAQELKRPSYKSLIESLEAELRSITKKLTERQNEITMLEQRKRRAQGILDPRFANSICDELSEHLDASDLSRQCRLELIKRQQEPVQKLPAIVELLLEYSGSLSATQEEDDLQSLRRNVYANFEREVSAQVDLLARPQKVHIDKVMATLHDAVEEVKAQRR
jgi:hypothetical protein